MAALRCNNRLVTSQCEVIFNKCLCFFSETVK